MTITDDAMIDLLERAAAALSVSNATAYEYRALIADLTALTQALYGRIQATPRAEPYGYQPYRVCPSCRGGFAVILDPRTIEPASLEPVTHAGRFDTREEADGAASAMAEGYRRATAQEAAHA